MAFRLGLLDLPAPVLDAVDAGLGAVLPAWPRLVIWAAIAGIGSMWLYGRFSNQERLAALKPQIKAAQDELARYDGPFDGLWPLIRRTLGLSARQMGLTLSPALIASLPLLFMLAWASNTFGYRLPNGGDELAVSVHPRERAPAAVAWSPATSTRWQSDNDRWTVDWPEAGDELALLGAEGGELLSLPLAAPVPVVHKPRWWNWLIGNPAGYLPADAGIDAVELSLAKQRFLPFGPGWLRSWELPFLVLMVAFSLGFKRARGIH